MAFAEVNDASHVRPRIVVRDPGTATIAETPLFRSPVRTGVLIGASLGAAVVGIAGIVWHFTHRPAPPPMHFSTPAAMSAPPRPTTPH